MAGQPARVLERRRFVDHLTGRGAAPQGCAGLMRAAFPRDPKMLALLEYWHYWHAGGRDAPGMSDRLTALAL